MKKDIKKVVVDFEEEKNVVFEETDLLLKAIGDMEDVDIVSIKFDDGETVNFTARILMCDIGEIHKGVISSGFHMSSCLTKKEAVKEIKRLVGGK